MPALNSPDEGNIERRLLCRTVVDLGALLFFSGFAGVHACHVRDVTTAGAGIRLGGLNIVPSDFGISSDNFRTVYQCRLVWRDGDFVGVKFDKFVRLDNANHERSS